MTTLQQIGHLLRWEFKAELRQPAAVGSVLLYITVTTTIVYLALRTFTADTFNALLWVVLFFGSLVATGRSFLREGGRRHLYYYQLTSPEALLGAKLIYNTVLIWIVSGLSYALLALFARERFLTSTPVFLAAVGLGGLGLAGVLSFVAAISARAGGNGTLMAVLSLPLLTPLLYLLISLGDVAFGVDEDPVQTVISYLIAIDLIIVAVAIALFAGVWRD